MIALSDWWALFCSSGSHTSARLYNATATARAYTSRRLVENGRDSLSSRFQRIRYNNLYALTVWHCFVSIVSKRSCCSVCCRFIYPGTFHEQPCFHFQTFVKRNPTQITHIQHIRLSAYYAAASHISPDSPGSFLHITSTAPRPAGSDLCLQGGPATIGVKSQSAAGNALIYCLSGGLELMATRRKYSVSWQLMSPLTAALVRRMLSELDERRSYVCLHDGDLLGPYS